VSWLIGSPRTHLGSVAHVTKRLQRFKETVKYATHWSQVPWRRLDDRSQLSTGEPQLIPRIVWQTGPNSHVNWRFGRYIDAFRTRNPEYEFRFLSDADVNDYMITNFRGDDILRIFEGARFGPMRADIFRYCVLLLHGGVYIDISKTLPKPLDSFVRVESSAVLTHEIHRIPEDYPVETHPQVHASDQLFVQWCIMCTSGHPLLIRVLDNIRRGASDVNGRVFANPGREILKFTATYMWTKSIWQELAASGLNDIQIEGTDFGGQYSRIPEPYILNPFKRHYTRYRNMPILRLGT